MKLFKRRRGSGLADIIRCDTDSYLIWKWHPSANNPGNENRENEIRWNSSLRVKAGEVAVFVYAQNKGEDYDYIEGPFDQNLKTANLPVLSQLIGLAYGGASPFQAEIYFINLAKINQVQFGIPFFDVFDPRYPDFGLPVAVRGVVTFQIKDYKEFIKLHRLVNFDLKDFQIQIRSAVCRHVKDRVISAPSENNIPVVQIESATSLINESVEYDIRQRLNEEFGVLVSSVDISAIEVNKSCEAYQKLMQISADIALAKETSKEKDFEERMRIQREEEQYAIHKSSQSANMAAFQVESQTQVGIAGAEALGKMGENGAGGVSLGGNSVGFNPASMMAGMAVGNAVGQNIAGNINGIMTGNPAFSPMTPPSSPASLFYIAVNGQASGPFDTNTLHQLATSGAFTKESYVWKQGMSQWIMAGNLAEFSTFFSAQMPPVPDVK